LVLPPESTAKKGNRDYFREGNQGSYSNRGKKEEKNCWILKRVQQENPWGGEIVGDGLRVRLEKTLGGVGVVGREKKYR